MPDAPETALEAEIARMIRLEGPITIASYMALCLGHPAHGYYMTRDPLGAAGDFTTAPEISQMFGELIGLWAAEVWRLLGTPSTIRLIELGPGRGTLMADALRATRRVDCFHGALAVTLVETSPVLRAAQAATLASAPVTVTWAADLASVPDGPAIIIGNEFLDALPIRQFTRIDGAWRERLVGLDADGRLAFGLSQAAAAITAPGQDGDVLEVSPAQEFLLADAVAPRLLRHGGAALFIDYGSAEAGLGDSLQALNGIGRCRRFIGPARAISLPMSPSPRSLKPRGVRGCGSMA